MGKTLAAVTAVVLAAGFVPAVLLLLLVTVLVVPKLPTTACPAAGLQIGTVPVTLTARTRSGAVVTLDRRQLTRAAAIIQAAERTAGAGRRAARIALIAALTESGLRMLANPTVPASANLPNDGVGSDHDSLGLFQMRPSTGWGTPAELMDPDYQAAAFLGGPGGPNHGSPRGLLDIPNWTALTDPQAAQAVEVSAYPDRYAMWAPVADQILTTLTTARASGGAMTAAPEVPATGAVVFPLPAGTWTLSDRFGPRADPITGRPAFHRGTDLAAPTGTPIRSATAGRVTTAGVLAGIGTITISTRIDGTVTAVTYLHMPATGIDVHAGDTVTAGQVIGTVGSTGRSTGPHLHFQVQPGGTQAAAVDSLTWLHTHHAAGTAGSVMPAREPAAAACR